MREVYKDYIIELNYFPLIDDDGGVVSTDLGDFRGIGSSSSPVTAGENAALPSENSGIASGSSGKMCSIPPAQLVMPTVAPVVQVACGQHHSGELF